jgi:protein-S-isoprenylcysteine O-methyltransferase Ste14
MNGTDLVETGRFLFRYRDGLFPLVYLLAFVPSPRLFLDWRLAMIVGIVAALCGQLIRAFSIGWVYIIRGGRNRRFYAEGLVTEGAFAHSRNPLYLGNILIAFGIGIALNSAVFAIVGGGFFLFTYYAIVAGEEQFLREKFGSEFDRYRERVPRFIPSLAGFGATWRKHHFRWRRLLVKEYGSTFAWVAAILVGKLYMLYRVGGGESYQEPIRWLWILLGCACVAYVLATVLKKTGIVSAD